MLGGPAIGGDLTSGKGDTVGCDLDTNQGMIFYTLNGEYARWHSKMFTAVGMALFLSGWTVRVRSIWVMNLLCSRK